MSFSIGVAVAMPVPGVRMGNSSSSSGFGMGIGPDIRPRTDWWPVLGLAVVGELGALPNILAFMLLSVVTGAGGLSRRAESGKLRAGIGGDDEEESQAAAPLGAVDVGGGGGGLSEPSGITIIDGPMLHYTGLFPAVRVFRGVWVVGELFLFSLAMHRSTRPINASQPG